MVATFSGHSLPLVGRLICFIDEHHLFTGMHLTGGEKIRRLFSFRSCLVSLFFCSVSFNEVTRFFVRAAITRLVE